MIPGLRVIRFRIDAVIYTTYDPYAADLLRSHWSCSNVGCWEATCVCGGDHRGGVRGFHGRTYVLGSAFGKIESRASVDECVKQRLGAHP